MKIGECSICCIHGVVMRKRKEDESPVWSPPVELEKFVSGVRNGVISVEKKQNKTNNLYSRGGRQKQVGTQNSEERI